MLQRSISLTDDFFAISGLSRHTADRKIVYIKQDQIEDAVRWVKSGLIRAAISPCPEPEVFAKAVSELDYQELLKEEDNNWGSPKVLKSKLDLIEGWFPEDYGDGTVFLHRERETSRTTSMHVDASIAVHFSVVGGMDYLAGDIPADIKAKIINNAEIQSGYFEKELELHEIWSSRVFATNPGDTLIFSDLPHRTSKEAIDNGFVCNLAFLKI